jgi:hypothetical protein
MRKLIAIIIIILCLSIPARADYGPRPPAWETVAATKISRQERRRTPTPTVTPTPWAYPAPVPYLAPEFDLPAWLHRLLDWVME